MRHGAAGYNSIVPPINATTSQAAAAIATASHRQRVASSASDLSLVTITMTGV